MHPRLMLQTMTTALTFGQLMSIKAALNQQPRVFVGLQDIEFEVARPFFVLLKRIRG